MAPSIKKYFIQIIFLVSPIAISVHAQSNRSNVVSADLQCTVTAVIENQNNNIADNSISKLDNANQSIVGPSTPKDSLTTATVANQQTSIECPGKSTGVAFYSALAKDIIENYKYDFSETFIDILFFENIDLARTRTI
jgi:nitrogenase subunit NifH